MHLNTFFKKGHVLNFLQSRGPVPPRPLWPATLRVAESHALGIRKVAEQHNSIQYQANK